MPLDLFIMPRESTTCESIFGRLLHPSGVIHQVDQSQALVSEDLIETVPTVQLRQPVTTSYELQTLRGLLFVRARSAAVVV